MINDQLVLNLRASDNIVSVIKLNPSYNLMVDLEKIPLGSLLRVYSHPFPIQIAL